jgi:addiction module HigA family antidote
MRRSKQMLKRAAHPGAILKEELTEIGVTPTELARQIDVPANRMSQIINGKRSITGDTALRLGHWFNTEPQFWMNLQAQFDLVSANRNAGDEIKSLPTAAAITQNEKQGAERGVQSL